MEELILSVDIGTSACKAVLFDILGRELATAAGSYPLHYPGPEGHVEQRPDEIWEGVCAAIGRLGLEAAQIGRIKALSLCSQISSHFLVDVQGHPLTNIMTWMDRRAMLEAAELTESFSPEDLRNILGAVLPVGPSWPIPRLRWLSRHDPRGLERARYIVQPKEWVLWKMTGEWLSDVSSMRWLVHQTSRAPCTALLTWSGTDDRLLTPSGQPYDTAGVLHARAAEALGLPEGLRVVLGWNDINAAVLGLMSAERRVGFDVTGTSEHIGMITPDSGSGGSPSEGINRIPFLSGMEMAYGVTSSGGFALQWFMERVVGAEGEQPDYEAMIRAASRIPAGSDRLLFLPYLNGERSPWWNPHARGVFFGLTAQHDRMHMSRAVLEGVGFALRTISDRLGDKPAVYRLTGGASRIPMWNRIKANILGVPMESLETAEAGCLGAAILAAFGTGGYGSIQEACSSMTRTKETFEPAEAERQAYESQYPYFVKLYHLMVPLFSDMAHVGREDAVDESDPIRRR